MLTCCMIANVSLKDQGYILLLGNTISCSRMSLLFAALKALTVQICIALTFADNLVRP